MECVEREKHDLIVDLTGDVILVRKAQEAGTEALGSERKKEQ